MSNTCVESRAEGGRMSNVMTLYYILFYDPWKEIKTHIEGNECVYTSPVYFVTIVAVNAIDRFVLQMMLYGKAN